jgi:hypothetical protein
MALLRKAETSVVPSWGAGRYTRSPRTENLPSCTSSREKQMEVTQIVLLQMARVAYMA